MKMQRPLTQEEIGNMKIKDMDETEVMEYLKMKKRIDLQKKGLYQINPDVLFILSLKGEIEVETGGIINNLEELQYAEDAIVEAKKRKEEYKEDG